MGDEGIGVYDVRGGDDYDDQIQSSVGVAQTTIMFNIGLLTHQLIICS